MSTRHSTKGDVFIACLAVLALVATPASSANTERPARSVFAGEVALERRLTFSNRIIRLGELVDRISAQTGVGLEVDDQRVEPVSGYLLTAVANNRPASEILLAVSSLYSFPPDRWYWERLRERTGGSRFVLRHTLPAGAAKRAREGTINAVLLDQYRRLSALYSASPEQRKRMAANDPMLAAYNTPRNGDFLSFLAGLSASELSKVMSGGSVEISRSRFSSNQRAFLVSEYRSANLLGREGIEQPNQLEKVTISGAGLSEPSVMLNLGPLGSHGLIGGIWMADALNRETTRNWLGSGESSKASKESVPAPGVKLGPNDLSIRNDKPDRLLRRLARLAKLSLLFDRQPGTANRSLSTDFSLEGDLSELLPRLCKNRLVWKKRAGFYLFRPDDWQVQDWSDLPPWPLVRDLRAAAGSNDGYLRPLDWMRLGRVKRRGLDTLKDEFPDAGDQQIVKTSVQN